MKKILIGLLIALLVFQPLLLSVLFYRAHDYAQAFLDGSQLSPATVRELAEQVYSAWQSPPQSRTWLVLGTDELAGRKQPPLTDTMLLVHFDSATRSIVTLPLPRDLWSDEYKTKINALYSYGDSFYPGNPSRFVQATVSNLTGVPIDSTVVVSIGDVVELVDLLDGLSITVQTAFTDDRFPKHLSLAEQQNIVREAELYETVSFAAGKQRLSAQQVNQFLRSRKADSEEGSDTARTARQQQVLSALLEQLTNPDLVRNPMLVGKLLRWYLDHFATAITVADMASLLKTYPWQFNNRQISVESSDSPGILINPPAYLYDNQWVYTATDSGALKSHVQSLLFSNDSL